jgi:hypothetical protein
MASKESINTANQKEARNIEYFMPSTVLKQSLSQFKYIKNRMSVLKILTPVALIQGLNLSVFVSRKAKSVS